MMIADVELEGRDYRRVGISYRRDVRKEAVFTVLRLCWYFRGENLSESEEKQVGFSPIMLTQLCIPPCAKPFFYVTAGTLASVSSRLSM